MYLTPPVTLAWGFLLFGEPLAGVDALGLGITAIGVGLVYRGEAVDAALPTPQLRGMMP